jgi:hypothetical protein
MDDIIARNQEPAPPRLRRLSSLLTLIAVRRLGLVGDEGNVGRVHADADEARLG